MPKNDHQRLLHWITKRRARVYHSIKWQVTWTQNGAAHHITHRSLCSALRLAERFDKVLSEE